MTDFEDFGLFYIIVTIGNALIVLIISTIYKILNMSLPCHDICFQIPGSIPLVLMDQDSHREGLQ